MYQEPGVPKTQLLNEDLDIKEKLKIEKQKTGVFFNSLDNCEDANLRRERIGNYVSDIIEDFNAGVKKKEDFKILMGRIVLLYKYGNAKNFYDFGESLSQDQIDFMVENCNYYFLEDNNRNLSNFEFFRALSTSQKKDRNEDTVNEKFARSITSLIDKKETISLPFQESLALIGQDIQTIRSQERFDLISKVLENPGKIYSDVRYALQAGIGLMGQEGDLIEEYEKRKSSLVEVLKIIDVLDLLIRIGTNVGFEDSGENSQKLIEKIEQDNQNYFVKYKIDLLKNNQRYNKDLIKKYSEIEEKEIEPLEFRPIQIDRVKKKKSLYYAYSKVSEKYGVIYNDQGTIDSFFELAEKKEGGVIEQKRISIDEILKREGFDKSSLDPQEYEKITIIYKALIKPLMRNKIENEFNIKISNFNIREQVQFVNFLSSKTEKEIEDIKIFLSQGQGEQDNANRLRSFLSLEEDLEMGERILAIGKGLERQSELADKLFDEYANVVDSAEKQAEEVASIYDEIFHEKKVDKNKMKQAILREASELLWHVSEGLHSTEEKDKPKMINEAITKIKNDNKIKNSSVENIRKIFLELNRKYLEINIKRTSINADEEKRLRIKLDTADARYDSEKKQTIKKIIKDIKTEYEDGVYCFIDENGTYDSNKIREMVMNIKKRYSREFFLSNPFLTLENYSKLWNVDMNEAEKIINEKIKQAEKEYKPFVKKLEKLLIFQENLEKKLDEFIYSQKSDDINEGGEVNLSSQILKKYDEIIEQAKKSKKEIQTVFSEKREISDQEVDKIINVLLEKSNYILKDYTERLKGDEKIDEEGVLFELEKYEKNLMLKIGVLKSLEGKISPEEIVGIDFEVETAKNISFGYKKELEDIAKIISTQEGKFTISASGLGGMISKFEKGAENEEESREKFSELWQMFLMYENNWKKYSPEMRKILISGFLKKISQNGDGTRIYKYKENEKLLTFLRIDDIEPGKKYFGSFNALDSIQGGKMGEALLTRVLEEEGKDADIQAVCVPQEDVFAWYINEHEFIANGIIMNYEGTGQAMARIERRKEVTKYYYPDYEEKNIIAEYENNFSGNKYEEEKYLIFKYDLMEKDKKADQSQEMNNQIHNLTNQGYIITREVVKKADKGNKTVYLCFEKIN